MLWHKRMNHANYHAVKMMPEKSSGMGVDFKGLNIERDAQRQESTPTRGTRTASGSYQKKPLDGKQKSRCLL
jgi:hypothetical protein